MSVEGLVGAADWLEELDAVTVNLEAFAADLGGIDERGGKVFVLVPDCAGDASKGHAADLLADVCVLRIEFGRGNL
eukprot:8565053-Pyramimonas_sp.AAC.1